MNRIQEYRAKAHLSQFALAIKAGIHPSMMNRIERGVRPNQITARKLAFCLECKPADLFEGFDQLRSY